MSHRWMKSARLRYHGCRARQIDALRREDHPLKSCRLRERSRVSSWRRDARSCARWSAFLRGEGINVRTVADADGAFEEALLHPPDIVLIDDRVPPSGGIDLVHRLKANVRTHFVPTILCTLNDLRRERVRALAAGVDAVFAPSTDIEERRARMWALLRTRALYRRIDRVQRTPAQRDRRPAPVAVAFPARSQGADRRARGQRRVPGAVRARRRRPAPRRVRRQHRRHARRVRAGQGVGPHRARLRPLRDRPARSAGRPLSSGRSGAEPIETLRRLAAMAERNADRVERAVGSRAFPLRRSRSGGVRDPEPGVWRRCAGRAPRSELAVEIAQTDAGMRFRVAAPGAPLQPSERINIFAPYGRHAAGSAMYGLGLALARALIELSQGTALGRGRSRRWLRIRVRARLEAEQRRARVRPAARTPGAAGAASSLEGACLSRSRCCSRPRWRGPPVPTSRSTTSIRAVTEDSNYKVRVQAALVLGKLGDPRAVQPLIKALADQNKTVRGIAASALGQLGDPIGGRSAARSAAARDRSVRARAGGEGAGGAVGRRRRGGGKRAKIYVNFGAFAGGVKSAGPEASKIIHEALSRELGKLSDRHADAQPGRPAQLRQERACPGSTSTATSPGSTTAPAGGGAETSCDVKVMVARWPQKSIIMWTNAGASVQSGSRPRDRENARRECLEASARGLGEDLVNFLKAQGG